MSTTLKVIDSSVLSEAERTELDVNIDSLIAAHKNNRQEINRLVFESVATITAGEDYERQLANKKGLRRFIGGITGSNKKLQDKINSNRAAAQYASQQTLQRLAEQNLMTFDLIAAVNNKLNAVALDIEDELNQVYSALVAFFKQSRSDMVQMANRIDRLEQNVNLLNWKNSIEYQMFDGIEYADLDDASKIVCLVRDFYDITGGQWSTSDLLLLKSTMTTINVSPKDRVEYLPTILKIVHNQSLRNKLLGIGEISEIQDPEDMVVLGGIRKGELLETSEKYIVETTQEALSANGVFRSEQEIIAQLVAQYLKTTYSVKPTATVLLFDIILEILNNLQQVQIETEAVESPSVVDMCVEDVDLDEGAADVDDLTIASEMAEKLYFEGSIDKALPLFEKLADGGEPSAYYFLGMIFYYGLGSQNEDFSKAFDYWRAGKQDDVLCNFRCLLNNLDSMNDSERKAEYADVASELEQLAEKGDYFAQFELSIYCLNDTDKPHNYEKTVAFLCTLAEKGYFQAEYSLAIRYERGQGVEMNLNRANELYENAFHHGLYKAGKQLVYNLAFLQCDDGHKIEEIASEVFAGIRAQQELSQIRQGLTHMPGFGYEGKNRIYISLWDARRSHSEAFRSKSAAIDVINNDIDYAVNYANNLFSPNSTYFQRLKKQYINYFTYYQQQMVLVSLGGSKSRVRVDQLTAEYKRELETTFDTLVSQNISMFRFYSTDILVNYDDMIFNLGERSAAGNSFFDRLRAEYNIVGSSTDSVDSLVNKTFQDFSKSVEQALGTIFKKMCNDFFALW